MKTSMPPDLDLLRTAAHRLSDGRSALDPLIDFAGDASFVLLGEASHGTHEFYSTRAAITERLIKEKGFQAVAAEADWPDAYRVNRYVRNRSDLGDFPSSASFLALSIVSCSGIITSSWLYTRRPACIIRLTRNAMINR